MRARLLIVSLAASSLLFAASCNNPGPPGTYVELTFQVRPVAGLTPPARIIEGYTGEDGNSVSCTVLESRDGGVVTSRTLTFSARKTIVGGATFGITVAGAAFSRTGGAPIGTSCRLTVLDGNTYVGDCGSTAPNEATPCQISEVQFTTDTDGTPTISGKILCDQMPAQGSGEVRVHVGAPTSTPSTPIPAQFNLYDCPGYHPD